MAKTKLLTVKFSEHELAEFHAAADLLDARSSSALVHQFVKQKIREAKKTVSEEEFAKIFEEKLEELRSRSNEKSKGSRKLIKPKEILIEGNVEDLLKERTKS